MNIYFVPVRTSIVPNGTQNESNNGSESWNKSLFNSACAIAKYAECKVTGECTTRRKLLCIYRTYYYLWIELSGRKESVTYGLGVDICLPHLLATGIWTLAHPKSALRAEISGSIVRYDALAARPEVLLYWHFVCACADSLKLKSSPYSWGKCLQGVNKYNFGRKKITKVAFRALAIPQSTPTNDRGVFAYRVFQWSNFINTSIPPVMRTWLDGSTV